LVVFSAEQLQVSGIGFGFIEALTLTRTCDVVPMAAWLHAVEFETYDVLTLHTLATKSQTQNRPSGLQTGGAR
jgi:hypothetical protein